MLAKLKNLPSYYPSYSKWVFVLLLIGIAFAYNYHKILFLRPQSIHQWRQCDCLSLTMNYYQEGMIFFSPSVHWIGCSDDGKTVGELPVINYFVAFLWKIFGHHESIFRAVNLLIVISGLFVLWKFLEGILKDSFWAITLTLLLFTSPVLVNYSINFLPDAPAFGLTLIGWYFFWKFYQNDKLKLLYTSQLFFLLGALIKIASLLSYIAVLAVFFIELLNIYNFKTGDKIFKKPLRQGLPFVIVAICTISWYAFAIHYSNENRIYMFFTGIRPIWELSYQAIQQIFQSFLNNTLPQFFSNSLLILTGILFIVLFLFFKKVNKLYYTITVLLFIGVACFYVLFFPLFKVHDYYLINLLIFFIFVWITFFHFLKNNYLKYYKSIALKSVFILFLGYNVYYCAEKTKVKYINYDSLIISSEEMKYWNWHHWWYNDHIKAFETITPYIRSLGIKRTDKVISIPDPSPNITLYLMDQKGWTDLDCSPLEGRERIIEKIGKGAMYLFINDSKIYKEEYIQPFIKNKIGTYKNIDIYDLIH